LPAAHNAEAYPLFSRLISTFGWTHRHGKNVTVGVPPRPGPPAFLWAGRFYPPIGIDQVMAQLGGLGPNDKLAGVPLIMQLSA
jgi:hypothetical protein